VTGLRAGILMCFVVQETYRFPISLYTNFRRLQQAKFRSVLPRFSRIRKIEPYRVYLTALPDVMRYNRID